MAFGVLGGNMYYVSEEIIKSVNPIIIDCRFDLSNPSGGYSAYLEGHLQGAYYLDLEKDLTGDVKDHGGRHPLPNLNDFLYKLRTFGIESKSPILLYDDGSLAMACRLWFMLKLIGLKEIYILKGGFDSVRASEDKITKDLPKKQSSHLSLDLQEDLLCSVEEVIKMKDQEDTVLVDARAAERYEGLEEPLDFIAGHIPGAVNIFWKDAFDQVGPNSDIYDNVKNYKQVINYCGSGVTGCVNMFFMFENQIKSKLYLGSYSDWISYDHHKIVTKNNEIISIGQVKNEEYI
jgi:thiosulfate/3-mercaptopyruvate sulfurtransferase